MLAAIDPFWTGLTAASIGLLGVWLDHRYRHLERKNDEQHARGYGLLQSIDARTIAIDDKVDKHGEWIARHEEKHARTNAYA